MEKTTIVAKRISGIQRIEFKEKNYRTTVVVDASINGKTVQMIIQEKYKFNKEDRGAEMKSWRFITGDPIIDGSAKVMDDFSAYDILDFTVDINDILTDAENFFSELKKKEEEEKKEKRRIERDKEYDINVFISVIKPALEEKGRVVAYTTKEQYLDGHEIKLVVNGMITVSRDTFSSNIIAHNGKYGNDRIEKKTKSVKKEKIMAMIEEAINAEIYRNESILEKNNKALDTKKELENILGVKMVEKREYQSIPGKPNQGREIEYFVEAKYEKTYADGLRIMARDTTKMVDGKPVYLKGFSLTNLPCITDPQKLKAIWDILNKD